MKKLFPISIVVLISFIPLSFAQTSLSDQELLEEVRYLESLKQTHPEKYQEIIQRKKARFQDQVNTIQKKAPHRFQEFRRKEREFKRRHVQRLKEERPEEFRAFAKKRRGRWQHAAKKHPDQFRQFLERNPRMREHFGEMSGEQQGWMPPQRRMKDSGAQPGKRFEPDLPARRKGHFEGHREVPSPRERKRPRKEDPRPRARRY